LQDREEDLDLIEPTGIYRRMDQDSVWIPITKELDGLCAPMGGAVIGDPEDTLGGAVWFLAHDPIDDIMETGYAGAWTTETEKLGTVNIPGSDIGQSAFSFVFMFDTGHTSNGGGGGGYQPTPGLDAGFFIGGNHEVAIAQDLAIPCPVVQIQNAPCFLLEMGATGPDPTPIAPGADRIGAEPAPHRCAADGGDNATLYGLLRNVIPAQSRERHPQIFRQLAGQGLDFDYDLRGKKGGVSRALTALASRPGAGRRSACATSIQSVVASPNVDRFPCWTTPERQGGQPWPA